VRHLEQETSPNCAVFATRSGFNSGTSALWCALGALKLGPGDEVIVPGFTYVASISAIVYAGALPVLAEVDASFNLDPAESRGADYASHAGDHGRPYARQSGLAWLS